ERAPPHVSLTCSHSVAVRRRRERAGRAGRGGITLLQVVDLHKRFGDRVALNGVSLSVAPGETVVVMGPSGCGKSTLLRCINRLIEPDAGDVFLAGRSLRAMNEAELRAARREIGFVFQHFHLIERLSV